MKKTICKVVSLCVCICLLATSLVEIARAKTYDADTLFDCENGTRIETQQKPENTPSIWDGGGLLITTANTGSEAEGVSAKLVAGMMGDISFQYSPVPTKAEDGSAAYAFRKLTFRFRDLQNPENYFDYVVHNYSYWGNPGDGYLIYTGDAMGMQGYVSYNGNAAANCRGWSDGEVWNVNRQMTDNGDGYIVPPDGGHQIGSFLGSTVNNQVANFTWDADEKQILVINSDHSWEEKVVLADLDDEKYGFGNFSGFDYYSVEILFNEVVEGEHAGILISGIDMPVYGYEGRYSQSYARNYDTHRPIVIKNCLGDLGVLTQDTTLKEAIRAIDLEMGSFEASPSDGSTVLKYKKTEADAMTSMSRGKIPVSKLTEAGTYEIYAAVEDESGNRSKEELVGTFIIRDPEGTYMDQIFTYNGTVGRVVNESSATLSDTVTKWRKGGLEITTEETGSRANGASATLVTALSGNVSFTYSPMPKVEDEGNTYGFRKLTFRFRDLQNPENYFDYVVHNYNIWAGATNRYEMNGDVVGMQAYVKYNGVAISTSREWEEAKGGEYWWVNKGMNQTGAGEIPPYGGHQTGSFEGMGKNDYLPQFIWNAQDKQILVVNPHKDGTETEKWTCNTVVADLDSPDYDFGKTFSGFDVYSVEVIFNDVGEDGKGGVIISEIDMPLYDALPESLRNTEDGESTSALWLAKEGLSAAAEIAPIVTADQLGDLGVLLSDTTIEASIGVCDFLQGWIEEEATSDKVKLSWKKADAEDSKKKTIPNGIIPAPTKEGTYELYATVTNALGCASKEVRIGTYQGRTEGVDYYDTDDLFTYQETEGIRQQTPKHTAVSGTDGKGLVIRSEKSGTKANGTGATFIPALSGNMEVAFSPIPTVVEGEENDTYDYRKLIFRFRDLQNPDNYFDYVVHNYNKYASKDSGYETNAMGYVEYNGVAISTSREWNDGKGEYWWVNRGFTEEDGVKIPPYGGQQVGAFKGTEFSSREMIFRWDAGEKQILVVNPDSTNGNSVATLVADLDSSDYNFSKAFTGFDAYSLEVIFEDVQSGKTPGVLISQVTSTIWGTIDFGESRALATDTTAPVVVEGQIGALEYENGGYTLPKKIVACDFESGYLEKAIGAAGLTLYYKKSGTDNKVTITSRTITAPREVGSYEIYAAIKDESGNEGAAVLIGTMAGVNPNLTYYDTDKLFTYPATLGFNRRSPENTPTGNANGKGLQIVSYHKGSVANGCSAPYIPALSGDVEIAFSPIPVVKEGASNDMYSCRKITFRFRDLLNTDNYFDYVVHNYNTWASKESGYESNAMAYVEYNGVAISTSREWDGSKNCEYWAVNKGYTKKDGYTIPPYGGEQVGSFRGLEFSNQEMVFRWDADKKQILVINPSKEGDGIAAVVADMDDPSYTFGKVFKGFDAYSVEIIFSEVTKNANAGVLVSRIDSELWGEVDFGQNRATVSDVNAPVMVENQIGKADYDGKQYVLPATIGACDFETGFITAAIGSSGLNLYYKKQGTDTKVSITSRYLRAPAEEGTYEIYASLSDANGHSSEETLIGIFSGLNPNKNYYDTDKLFRYHDAVGLNRQDPENTPLTTDSALVIRSTKSGEAANGTGATFIPSLSGDFTMDFSPVPTAWWGEKNDGWNYRSLTIRFRDQENTDNYFDYVVTCLNYWGGYDNSYAQPEAAYGYVLYNGVPITTAREWYDKEVWQINKGWNYREDRSDMQLPPYGGAQKGSFRGSEFSPYAMSFTWDSTNKRILVTNPGSSYGESQQVVIADLDNPDYKFGKTFTGFDYYSVEFIFGDVMDGATPAVAISRMQTGNWGEVDFSSQWYDRADIHAPQVLYNQFGRIDYVEGDFAVGRTVNAADFETGHIRLNPGDGNLRFYYVRKGSTEPKTYITDGTIRVPEQKGAYLMYASIRDANGNWSEDTYVGTFIYTGVVPRIHLDGSLSEYSSLGDKITIPRATFSYNGKVYPIWKITVTGPAGSKYQYTDITKSRTFTTDAIGTYTVTYTAMKNFTLDPDVAGETADPNYLTLQTTVLTELSPKHLFSYYDPVECYQGYSQPELVNAGSGICFATDTSGSKVAFDATITGDTEIAYSFLPMDAKTGALSKFTIRFVDAEDSSNYFDYVLTRAANNWDYTMAYVEYQGEKRSMDKDDAVTIYKNDEVFCNDREKFVGYQDAYLYWAWSVIDRQGWVKYDAAKKEIRTRYGDHEYTIAAFDSRFGWAETFPGFKNGYNVLFLFDEVNVDKTARINIYSINGLDFSGYAMNDPDPNGRIFKLKGKTSITLEGGTDYVESGWKATYRLLNAPNMVFNDDVVVDTDLNTRRVGSYTLSYTARGQKRTRHVTVQDTTSPDLFLIGPERLVMFTGETFVDLGVSVSDNVVNESDIEVAKSGEVDTTEVGTYAIEYTCADNSGNTATVTRTVEVILDTEAPVLTLNGDKKVQLFVGEEFEDPGCTATDNASVDVTITSDFDKAVNLKKAGTYLVTYTGTDPTGNESEPVERTITVLKTKNGLGWVFWLIFSILVLAAAGGGVVFYRRRKYPTETEVVEEKPEQQKNE